MYLSHHYAVDLVGGSMISAIVFYIARANFLPQQQEDKRTRWDYDYVEIGSQRVIGVHEYDLADMNSNMGSVSYRSHSRFSSLSQDEWTMGSSSASMASGSTSPMGDDNQSLWEGETLAEGSDRESVRGGGSDAVVTVR